ncbi:MAG: CvpA family protein [Rhodocyclaceae bacterium]|nr:CvpA family protein [Rhodocyclaceae bacterium]
MPWCDYAVLGGGAASLFLGFWRGIVSELLALLAWVVAFFAAREVAGQAALFFTSLLEDPGLRYAAGFAAVFLLVLVVFAIGRVVLSAMLRAIGLGLLDRFLGAAFGVMRGLLIVLVAVMLGGMTALPRQPWWRDAMLAPPLETAVVAMKPWLPAEVAKRIRYR